MSKASKQVDLGAFSATTEEIDVTRTVRMKLQTSERKNSAVAKGIEAYQQVAEGMANVLPSYPDSEWQAKGNTHLYHHSKRFLPDGEVDFNKTLAQAAMIDVVGSFNSWKKNGKRGKPPKGDFGDAEYMALRSQEATIHKNDRGWGLKCNFIKHQPVWFHILDGEYQREFLQRVTDPDDPATAGSAELHMDDSGTLYCHQTITWPVEVYQTDEITTTVGVDLGDDPLAVAAVVSSDGVADVLFESGSEFRHHRERVKQRKSNAMEEGNLKATKESRLMYQQYTDHVTNKVSRQVVDLAVEHRPAKIAVEDLTDYRVNKEDAIHDWPYAELQTKIASKAREEGIPVETVDPEYTSITCRKCGEVNDEMRDGDDFECWNCGYEVHADLNAAINIAHRAD